MHIEATQTKHIDVEISDSTIKQIIVKQFWLILNIKEDYYLKDDNVVYDHEQYTSHSWSETKIVREATEEDKQNIKVLRKLLKEL